MPEPLRDQEAFYASILRVAVALGVTPEDLSAALDHWERGCSDDEVPPSIGFGGLKRLTEKFRVRRVAGLIEVLCATADDSA